MKRNERYRITPLRARILLLHNDRDQREVSWDLVRKYSDMMRWGTFDDDGEEPLYIRERFGLGNGQHRLISFLLSGLPEIYLSIEWPMPFEKFYFQRQHRRKSIHNYLNKQR